MDKIFKQLYPGVKEEYLERAFEKLKKNGCPADEDLMVWFGKLVAAEILEDALGNGKHDENNGRALVRQRLALRAMHAW